MGLAEPVHGKAKLYGGEVEGLLLQLPGWRYPADGAVTMSAS